MDHVDAWLGAQIRADGRIARPDTDVAVADQRAEDGLHDGHQVRVDRIHLQQANLALGDQLVEHIERGDAGDVTGAQHEDDPARRRPPPIKARPRFLHAVGAHRGLQPDLARHPAQQEPVPERAGKDADDHLPIRPGPHRAARERRRPRAGDSFQAGDQAIQGVEHRPGAGQPFLAHQGRLGRNPLGLRGRRHPPHAPMHLAQIADLLPHGQARPSVFVPREVGDGRVQRVPHGRGQVRGIVYELGHGRLSFAGPSRASDRALPAARMCVRPL